MNNLTRTTEPAASKRRAKAKRRKRNAYWRTKVVQERIVWVDDAAPRLGVTKEAASKTLEGIAKQKRWRKLRDENGAVVAIAPPIEFPER